MLVPAEASIFQSCKDSKTFLIKIPVKYVGNTVTLTFVTPKNHNITTPGFTTDDRGIAEYSVGQDVLDSYGTLSAQLNITDSTGKYVDHSEVFYFEVGKVLGTQFYITGVSRPSECNQYKRSMNKVNVPSLSTPEGYVPTADGNGGYDWQEPQGGSGGKEYTSGDGIQIIDDVISSTYGTMQPAKRTSFAIPIIDENAYKLYFADGNALIDFVTPGGATLHINTEKYTLNPGEAIELNSTELAYINEIIGPGVITGTYLKFNTVDTLQTALQNIKDRKENPFTPIADTPVLYWIAVNRDGNGIILYLTDTYSTDFKYVSLTEKEVYKLPENALTFGYVSDGDTGLVKGDDVYYAIQHIPSFTHSGGTVKVNGYDIPKLSPSQVTGVYNAFITGRPCIISDPSYAMYFLVTQADSIDDEVYFSYDYYGIMKLTYCSDNTITYEPLADVPDRFEVTINMETLDVTLATHPKYGKAYSSISDLFNYITGLIDHKKQVIAVSKFALGSEGGYGYFEFPMLASYYNGANEHTIVLFNQTLGNARYELQISNDLMQLEVIEFMTEE